MTTATRTYTIHPLPDDVLDAARATGRDVAGNDVELVEATGGEPLRCCLRDAQPGEQLMLFSYEPPLPASPYHEIGPVFAHREPCAGPARTDAYPAGWLGRPQVLRAYDRRGWIHAATVHDGSHPDALIADLLADPDVEQVHSRNVAYGCFMFRVTADG
jgi:Protein of unknown function (DUF1203)